MDIYTPLKVATIYRATNTKNGKVYIGFDSNWPHRMSAHKSKFNGEEDTIKFYRAIRKYGWDSFTWDVIYQSTDIDHTLNVMEPFFISNHDSKKNGYNSTDGGDGIVGLNHSDATKRRLAEHFGKPCRGPDGTVYFSANEASNQTGLPYGMIKYRSKNNIFGWSYDLSSIPNPNGLHRWTNRKLKKCIGPDGTIYEHTGIASEITGIGRGLINKKCRLLKDGWSYVSDSESQSLV